MKKRIIQILLASVSITFGQRTQPTQAEWKDMAPPRDPKFDWLQLTSGEWLKGDFKALYEYELEFDSDEMDLQTFDFEDVRQLQTRNPQTVLVEDKTQKTKSREVRGILTIREGTVSIKNGDIEEQYDRNKIIAIADYVLKEKNRWSGSASIGMNFRGGNSETADATVMLDLRRRKARSRLAANYIGNFSEAGEDETVNNHRVNGNFDWFVIPKYFWRVVAVQYYRDPFSNIDNQYSIGTAAGYDFIHTSKTDLECAAGVGYQNQKFLSVAAGEDDTVGTPFFIAKVRYDTELTKSIDFLADYSFRILNETSGTFTHHAMAKLSTEFVADLDLDISLIWDRIQTPQERADSTTPEQDDYQLIFSLGYDF